MNKLILAAAVGAALSFAHSTHAQASPDDLVVNAVITLDDLDTLVVIGENFLRMPVGMTVSLGPEDEPGDISRSCRPSLDRTVLTCTLRDGLPPAGDYMLRIERTLSPFGSVAYPLTIGAQGPEGPVGPTGPVGPQGVQGNTGAPGPQGVPGVPGAPGPQGPAGTPGMAGPPGEDGAPGPTGPAGPQGPIGPEGPAAPDGRFGTDTSVAASGRGDVCTLGDVWLTAGGVSSGTPARGQLLPISQNTAVFALLGTLYGGNGSTTFALPDLRDAAPNGLTYVICLQGIFPSRD